MSELYTNHPVMFKNRPIGFNLFLFLIPIFRLGLLVFITWYLHAKSSRLTITKTEVMFDKGLLSKKRSELSLSSVRSVKVKQSFFNRIFGTGEIEIFTAKNYPETVATGMPYPHKVRELIKKEQGNSN